jgi:DNA repair exonuclease SbcCD ATPase subunit
MRILELNITEFGCFKNKVVELGGTLNLVYGENESGKSTLLLFIKFMLYGMTRRTATNTERERSISWSGHCASGSMTFEHGGHKYRIERSFVETAPSGNEKLNIVCLDNGLTVNTDRSAGEFFLGVVR